MVIKINYYKKLESQIISIDKDKERQKIRVFDNKNLKLMI
jgi:hypothetical protein